MLKFVCARSILLQQPVEAAGGASLICSQRLLAKTADQSMSATAASQPKSAKQQKVPHARPSWPSWVERQSLAKQTSCSAEAVDLCQPSGNACQINQPATLSPDQNMGVSKQVLLPSDGINNFLSSPGSSSSKITKHVHNILPDICLHLAQQVGTSSGTQTEALKQPQLQGDKTIP